MSEWIQTYTGRKFYPLAPSIDDIFIEDIAHALSNICRFTGHCLSFYSVAQHSVMVSNRVEVRSGTGVVDEQILLAEWGLLHDSTEAYICDMARPVKRQIAGYREIETRLEQCVAAKFGITPDILEHAAIKDVDLRMLATERRDLMAPPPEAWVDCEQVEPYPGRILPLTPIEAEVAFLSRWHALEQRRWK